MYGFGARVGNDRTRPAPTSKAASRRVRASRPVDTDTDGLLTPGALPTSESRLTLESLRKPTSEEALRPEHQGGEQGDVEDGLRPRGAERDLQEALQHAEQHGCDRGTRHAAEPADHDELHQGHDPMPVQGGVDRRVELQGRAAYCRGGDTEAEAQAGDP